MPNVILTSSFSTVAKELRDKKILPAGNVTVAFVPTAGAPYRETPWIDADRIALHELGYTVVEVDLLGKNTEQLTAECADANIIFIAGGNTTYLVDQAQRAGFYSVVSAALQQGKMYIGSSAGSILAGPSVEPFIAEDVPELALDFVLQDSACLGLVDFIVLPHYPGYANQNDAIAEMHAKQFAFVKMTDHEYTCETWVRDES